MFHFKSNRSLVLAVLCLSIALVYIACLFVYWPRDPEKPNPPIQWNEAFKEANRGLSSQVLPGLLFTLFGATLSLLGSYFQREKQNEEANRLIHQLKMAGVAEKVGAQIASVAAKGVQKAYGKQEYGYLDDIEVKLLETKKGDKVVVIENWLCSGLPPAYEKLESGIRGSLDNGSEVILVLMHPNSPLVQRREHFVEWGAVGGEIAKSLKKVGCWYTKWAVKCIHGKWPSDDDMKDLQWNTLEPGFNAVRGEIQRFRVYLIDTFLTLQLYALPNCAFAGFYVAKDTSTHGPHLWGACGSSFGDMFREYANRILTLCDDADQFWAVRVKLHEFDRFKGIAAREADKHLLGIQIADCESLFHQLQKRSRVKDPGSALYEKVVKSAVENKMTFVSAVMKLPSSERSTFIEYLRREFASDRK
ncbi:hypothetical protein [Roseimicrobium sp. ORNL1]|uniref:hypothetical protein n=1 Tax=Roseimicrobium sp. ORNL1 TaxID=2711231 RepID=UPI0013E1A0F9|nr:hypothetical protein [Roseimicrobium sp. ORNL1]QIF01097.1 hypothetical protein G5S37_06045 [Roseimicrobium sp. ORNL1]